MEKKKTDETSSVPRPVHDVEKGPPVAPVITDEQHPLLGSASTTDSVPLTAGKKKGEKKSFVASLFTLIISIPAVIGA